MINAFFYLFIYYYYYLSMEVYGTSRDHINIFPPFRKHNPSGSHLDSSDLGWTLVSLLIKPEFNYLFLVFHIFNIHKTY